MVDTSEFVPTIARYFIYIKGENAEALATMAEDRLIHYSKVFSANSESSQLALLKKTAAFAPQ